MLKCWTHCCKIYLITDGCLDGDPSVHTGWIISLLYVFMGIKRCSISSRRFWANSGHALNIKVTKTLFNWFLKHLMQSKIYVSKKAKNLSTLEIIMVTCIFQMVSLMTYCIRNLPLLPKQRSYLYSVVGQIRDFSWKTLKVWGNEIWVVFAVPSKSNHFIYCIMVYGRALSLGFGYSRCGAYWYKVAVARIFKRVSKQL